MAMRRLFFDMLDPAGISNMFVEGSRKQFEMAKDLLEARRNSMSRNDLDFMLREYSLNLERQLDWTQGQLKDLKAQALFAQAALDDEDVVDRMMAEQQSAETATEPTRSSRSTGSRRASASSRPSTT